MLDGIIGPIVNPWVEKQFLQDTVFELSGGQYSLPDEDIVSEDASYNTSSNARNFKSIALKYGILRSYGISTRDHVDRFTILMCSNGHNTYSEAAEDIIIAAYPEMEDPINEFYAGLPDDVIKSIKSKEFWGRLQIIFDEDQSFPDLWKQPVTAETSPPVEVFSAP